MAESPDTMLFIHGLWMTPRSWESFAARYESRGYRVLAPGWPGTEGEVEALRRDPSLFDGLDLTTVVNHYDGIIRVLDEPPILIGHSLGGSIAQLLLDRGLGAAAVGLAPGTVKGIPDLPLATLARNSPATVNFQNDDRAPMLFVAFGEDHVVPPKVIRHNVDKYRESAAITEYREFPGRPHFPGAPGWEEVADVALA